jgi:hypothetical protein
MRWLNKAWKSIKEQQQRILVKIGQNHMEQIKTTKGKRNTGIITCIFCKKAITNNTIRPLVCICEEDNFFHFECYEKSGEGVDIDEVVKAFDKARIKY